MSEESSKSEAKAAQDVKSEAPKTVYAIFVDGERYLREVFKKREDAIVGLVRAAKKYMKSYNEDIERQQNEINKKYESGKWDEEDASDEAYDLGGELKVVSLSKLRMKLSLGEEDADIEVDAEEVNLEDLDKCVLCEPDKSELEEASEFFEREGYDELEDWCDTIHETIEEEGTEYVDRCPCLDRLWNRFNGDDWVNLLEVRPQFAEHCNWKKLESSNWVYLLKVQPQFAEHCDWEKLGGFGWSDLLSEQPQFAEHCDWETLRGRPWSDLLSEQPQFADHCDWKKLDGSDWASLLKVQPQLADHCDWEKLDGSDWASLLEVQPQFADHCDWEKLEMDGWRWVDLLKVQPQLAVHCDLRKLSNLDGSDWRSLLLSQPQLAEYCDWQKLDRTDWADLLKDQPQFADHCDWKKLYGSDWANLLKVRPQFAEHCNWKELCSTDWVDLLKVQPQFAKNCAWEEFFLDDWQSLWLSQPKFGCLRLAVQCVGTTAVCRALRLDEGCRPSILNGKRAGAINPWAFILSYCPELAGKCTSFEKFDGYSRCMLLVRQPQFADKWSLEELGSRQSACWASLDDSDFNDAWEELLAAQPQFAKYHQ